MLADNVGLAATCTPSMSLAVTMPSSEVAGARAAPTCPAGGPHTHEEEPAASTLSLLAEGIGRGRSWVKFGLAWHGYGVQALEEVSERPVYPFLCCVDALHCHAAVASPMSDFCVYVVLRRLMLGS